MRTENARLRGELPKVAPDEAKELLNSVERAVLAALRAGKDPRAVEELAGRTEAGVTAAVYRARQTFWRWGIEP